MKILQMKVGKTGPLCIGLDTDPAYIPDCVKKDFKSPQEAVLQYNTKIIEATKDIVACYKVQIAYYEAQGIKGLEVYSKTLKKIKQEGALSIADIKRGDIAATAKAYSQAHFSGDFEADIVTLNPYMGFETLLPWKRYWEQENMQKGAFILLHTSNPGRCDIECLPTCDNSTVFCKVADFLNNYYAQQKEQNKEYCCPQLGAVVGCTNYDEARFFRDLCPNIFFLIPGYGVQGGDARTAAILLQNAGGVVNSSRGILLAWQKDEGLLQKEKSGNLLLEDMVCACKNKVLQDTKMILKEKETL